MTTSRRFLLFLLLISLITPSIASAGNQLCVYRDKDGKTKQASSRNRIPVKYRKTAQCQDLRQNTNLSRPEDIMLAGNTRRENMNSSVGAINLRWPRSVEAIFGRTPLRAMSDAARTVSRTLRTGAFAGPLGNFSTTWQVVFMDNNMPTTQIPSYLRTNCHPGWMTPPSNIYMVAQRVAGDCGSGQTNVARVADAKLTEVLLHEMGHVVEFHLLKNRFGGDRMRAEGFASWFEIVSAEHSSILNARTVLRDTQARARAAIQQSPNRFVFSGSAADYGRAAMYFLAVSDKRGIQGVMEVYEVINTTGMSFTDAIKKVMYWDDQKLLEEVARVANK